MQDPVKAALAAAMSVPGVNLAEISSWPDGTLTGTVRYSPAGLFGDDTGPSFEVRQDPDGAWNVNGERDHRDPDLTAAIRAALTATLPAGEVPR